MGTSFGRGKARVRRTMWKKKTTKKDPDEDDGALETIGKVANSGVGKIVVKEVTRGILGVMGLGGRKRKKSGWF